MTYRLRNIGIAIALAVVAALLVSFYVSNYRRTVQQGEEGVTVYVASGDIAAGTSGSEVVEQELLQAQEVERRNVTPGAVSNPTDIEALVAAGPIYKGEQITTRRFTASQEKGLRTELKGTTRAIQVPGESHQLLAGILRAGDRVDVVGSWNVPESATRHFSRTILRDIPVLQAPSGVNAATGISDGPVTSSLAVVLALTDSQAQKLFWMVKNGEWSLELRPTDDPADSPQTVENDITLLLDGLRTEQLQQVIEQAQSLLPETSERTTDE